MDKKNQVKQLEQEINDKWSQLIQFYYNPLIKQAHIKSVHEIAKCQDQECIEKQLAKREAPKNYLKKITKTYENGIEDCLFNCKYSMALEMEDCYIDCFSNIKKIVDKLHQF
ncbi:unnamed protein product [Paramecium sonneborni]|uniref:Uncharacterized protein n=1 Tax=Paramecium sonneborni TaxID=65129 RepID=A0A8S1PPP1_9CILI|nr:unnamed protein product [Paramecium sonneborni]